MESDTTTVDELWQGRATQYGIAAGFVVILYDILLTLGDEVHLIWGAGRSIVKYMYLFNRYSVPAVFFFHAYVMAGFASGLNDQFCYRYSFWILTFEAVEGTGVVGGMILFRVYALYKTCPRIITMLSLLWAVYLLPSVTIMLYSATTYYNHPGSDVYVDLLGYCTQGGKPPYLWAIWPPMVFFESTVVVLITRKTYQHVQSSINTPLLSILLRDGWVYYVCALLLEILNLIAFVAFPERLFFIAVYPTWCIMSLLVSRIYLNLRNVNTSSQWTTATAIGEAVPTLDDDNQGASQRLTARLRARAHETVISWDDTESFELTRDHGHDSAPHHTLSTSSQA